MATFVGRSLVSIIGILAITWAIEALLIYHKASLPIDAAQRILSGERFNIAQLGEMKRQLDAATSGPSEASALSSAAVIRLLLLEDRLKAGRRETSASDLAELGMIVSTVLAQSPTNSFMWLTDLWIKRLRGEFTEGDLNLLRMSYWSGPNEAWIAVRRNPLAMSLFPSLPSELAEQALSEFVGLVRSGLYADAANILAGPGWAVHAQLLSRLVQANEADRREFAKVLAYKNLDGISVPGAEEPSSRPF
jgi:hypothetical protein